VGIYLIYIAFNFALCKSNANTITLVKLNSSSDGTITGHFQTDLSCTSCVRILHIRHYV